ncbi:MAG TPA: transposase [Nonomuraea sp.]|nr:transposase [Nonomuraea sp.]
MIIERLPSFLQRYFSPMRPRLSKPQFAHLWSLVLAVVVNLRAAKLVHLSAAAPRQGHRTSAGAFLSRSAWEAPALVEQAAADLLAAMRPRAGEVVYLILDDNRIAKRARKMGYVSKIWDHKQQTFVRGHIALFAAVAFRGVVLPWKVELWKPRGHAGPRYRKLTDMAAAMVKAFAAAAPEGVKVRVLFDAFYLCPQVAGACAGNGFTFFSVAARNRTFTTDSGKRRGIARLMPGLIRHKGRHVRMKRSRGHATLRIASADGRLSRIGRVRMVVSKRPRGPWKKCIAVVTNETGLRPREVVAIYERRWLIEVLFKELRQDLGLADYQMIAEDGIVHHLHVCCLAHLLLTHRSLDALGAKAKQGHKQVTLPPMSTRLADLRAHIARDQIERLVKGEHHAALRQKLCDYLLAA